MTFQGDIHDGTEVFDNDGHRIGKVGQVFVLQGTDTPTWAAVQTGLFGMHESFVPVADATMRGDELIVPFAKDFVKDAPRIADSEDLTAEQEIELYRYYGVEPPRQGGAGAGAGTAAGAGAAGAMGGDRDRADRDQHDEHDRDEQRRDDEQGHVQHRRDDQSHGDQGQRSHDDRREQGAHAATGGDHGDDRQRGSHDGERSSQAGSGSGSSGAPRLRRRIVTEMQTVQVPVQREEIVVEGEGIAPDDQRDGR